MPAATEPSARPVDDGRLALQLEILRVALRAYLRTLRDAWSQPGSTAAPEIEGVLAAVGARPDPTGDERRRASALLRRVTAEAGGGLARIVEALDLDLGEECLVAGAWWAEADPQLAVALGCGHDDAARRHASAQLLRLVLAPFGISVPPAVNRAGALVRFGVIEGAPGADEVLRLTPTARLVLAGTPLPPLRVPAPPARHARARAALAAHLASDAAGVVVLCGPAGVGARALAAAAARDAGLVPLAGGRPAPELRLVARLRAGLPVVAAGEAGGLDWGPEDGPLVVLARDRATALPGYLIDVPPPTRAERVRAWSDGLADAGVAHETGFVEALAARFAFTDGDIEQTLERARRDALWPGGELDADGVWSAARRQPEHALDRLAALVRPAFSLDDLVLPDEAHAKLRELAAHVALQHVVLDGWGFRRRLPRGQGRDRAVLRPAGHREDHGRRGPRRGAAPGPLPDRPLRGRLQVGRRDREEPGRRLRRGRARAARCCSSTRPTRSSASAPRSATRTTATRTSR